MSTAKHTPGPWAVDITTVTTTVRAADGKSVARCYQGNHDAALIAAAPDLIAALDYLLQVTIDEPLARGRSLSTDENLARALALSAFAKATGGDL